MTDEKRSKSLGQDLLGISLFAVAVFFGVSAVMSLLHGGPQQGANVSTSMMGSLVAFIGAIPSLWIAAGLAFLGARQWVVGPSTTALRHVFGIAGVAFGLAVFCGALSLPAGGALGAAVGGSVARTLSSVVGVLIGLVLIVAPAWWAWIGPAGWISAASFAKSGKSKGLHAALPSEESEGVSAAEAEALLPERRISPDEAEEFAQALAEAQSKVQPVALPPLYPPDVRREGKIPPGAAPLELTDDRSKRAPTTESNEAPGTGSGATGSGAGPRGVQAVPGSAHRGAPGSGQPAAGDLAGGTPPASTLDLRERERPAPLAARSSTPVADPPAPVVATPIVPVPEIAPDRVEPALEAPPTFVPEPPRPVAPPPAPVAFEPEPEPEPEPVAPVAAVEPPAATPIVEDDSGTPFVERMRPSWEQPDLFDEESEGFVQIQPVETMVPDEPVSVEAEVEEEDELDEEGEEIYAEDDGDEEDEDEDEEEYEDEEGDVYAEDDEDEDEDEDEEADEVYAEDEEEEDDEEEYEEEEEEEPEEVLAEADGSTEADEDREAAEQREVVLEPRTAPQPASAPAKGEQPLDDDLVYRAGCLFLERDRVAVSLLQREFNLDFDGATRVLDRLQELGLIGPYLGGKKRDILMTPEAWRELVEVD